MPTHLHTQIRAALKTALTGLSTTGPRVFANRLRPMNEADLPGLRIALDDEQSDPETMHMPVQQARTLTLSVECCAKVTTGLDDLLDAISLEVETALSAGFVVDGETLYPEYTGMQFSDELADKPVGIKQLNYSVQFAAMSDAPHTLV